jgi:hypothetical protein
MMELTDPVAVSDVVTKSPVETAESAFSSVGNVSGTGGICRVFSSTAEAELSTGRPLSNGALLLFGCRECSSGSSERLRELIFSCEEF